MVRNLAFCVALLCMAIHPAVADEGNAGGKVENESVQFAEGDECDAGREIFGRWEVKGDVTRFLTGQDDFKSVRKLEFLKDDAAKDRVVKALSEMIASGKFEKHDGVDETIAQAAKAVYAAGAMRIEVDEEVKVDVDFALVNLHGNQVVVMVSFSDAGKANWESSRIAFAGDPDGDHDLLFLGGDRKSEGYLCFKREGVKE